ncbi:MAG: isoamylase early set domain-containing protein [Spirochaetales bacterium]|nr:isoamylase early set domain-containing protein [Spirochaetales bacterium]
MMRCSEVASWFDAWAETGPIRMREDEPDQTRARWPEVEEHLSRCSACREQFGTLAVLARKDCGKSQGPAPLEDVDAFMEAVFAKADAARNTDSEGVSVAASQPAAARALRDDNQFRRSRLLKLAYAAVMLAAGIVMGILIGRNGSTQDTILVTFLLEAPDAASVSLAGTFNGWDTTAYQFTKVSANTWSAKILLRKGREYLYNFVIDGERWIPDPASPLKVDDGFGGESSLLRL